VLFGTVIVLVLTLVSLPYVSKVAESSAVNVPPKLGAVVEVDVDVVTVANEIVRVPDVVMLAEELIAIPVPAVIVISVTVPVLVV